VFTDLVGYTALMQGNEAAALAARGRHRSALQVVIPQYDGRLIQFLGDGSLSLFPSSVSAVASALAIQEILQSDPPLPVRIGIDEGEVGYDDQGVYGHCVNVASRVERLARAGTVFVSEKVFRELENQPAFVGAFEGEYDLKNVDRPVRVHSIVGAKERA
jgi:class 3 adenylate cyclase